MLTPIIAPPSAPLAAIATAAKLLNAAHWYYKALPALWRAGLQTGVDPVVLAAQCAHETGWGHFGGAVTSAFGNTCGLKNRNATGDMPGDHAQFPLDPQGHPWVGALAHAHHLSLYAGMPVPVDTPDPRAVWIWPGNSRFGSAPHVEDLGGKWAPAADYGLRVASIAQKLKGTP